VKQRLKLADIKAGRSSGGIRHARPPEIAIKMSPAGLITLLEEPAIAAFGISQDFPAIVITIPEVKTVRPVLENWLADFVEVPFLLIFKNYLIRRIDLLLRFNVQAVVVEYRHIPFFFRFDDRNSVLTTKAYHERDRTSLHDFQAKEFFVEPSRERQILRFKGAVRKEIQLEPRLSF